MKGKTHVGIGILSFVVINNIICNKCRLYGLPIVAFSSLLPDIDHPKSLINKYVLPFKNKMTKSILYTCTGMIFLWYGFLYNDENYIKALGILFIIIAMSSHRKGFTHSLTGMILFSFISGYIGNIFNVENVIYYFMLGYGLHLICDMGTNRGVPLFYPFKKNNIKFPIIFKTNSKKGNFLENAILIIGLLYVVYSLPSIIAMK